MNQVVNTTMIDSGTFIFEVWKDIKDYEGLYQASTLGNIRSLNYRNKVGRVRNLKPSRDSAGYGQVVLCRDGVQSKVKVAVLVAETFYRRREKGEVVMHLNNIRLDDRLENLKIGSYSENTLQKFVDGYTHTEKQRRAVSEAKRGVKHHNSKLSEAQVIEIRENPDVLSGAALARKYGVSETTINDIRRGKTWKHLD